MQCPDCHRLEHDLDLTREALMLCERALEASQGQVERLRLQIARVQRLSGIAQTYTNDEFAEAAGVGYATAYKWRARYEDCPRPLPGTYPVLYDRAECEDFLRRHPKLGKREKGTT